MKMCSGRLVAASALVLCLFSSGLQGMERPFLRGDTFGDGALDISDCIAILNTLFLGADQVACDDAADTNDDGAINLSDPVYELSYLFGISGQAPPPPFGACGPDPTPDALGCEHSSACPSCADLCPAPAACVPAGADASRCTADLATCEEVQAAYEQLIHDVGPVCGEGDTCRLVGGHCVIGLGSGCYHVVSSRVSDDQLFALAARFQELGCVDPDLPICECPAPPDGVACSGGVCGFSF